MDTDSLRVRAATPADTAAMAVIYNEGIADRVATFETRERTADDVAAWLGRPRHPVLVAEGAGAVVGWIAGSEYRPRECYAGVAEFSVYVARSARWRGVGDALMSAFLPACREAGLWKVVSRIFPENVPSLALCRRHGFREVGTYARHGRLEGEWRDVVVVERLLEGAAESRPEASAGSRLDRITASAAPTAAALPVACDPTAIAPAERSGHRALLERLAGEAMQIREAAGGLAFHFRPEAFGEVARFIENERRCCPFLSFTLELEPGGGPLRVQLSGPEGTRALLVAELGLDLPGAPDTRGMDRSSASGS